MLPQPADRVALALRLTLLLPVRLAIAMRAANGGP
jgi:hypothetical protein